MDIPDPASVYALGRGLNACICLCSHRFLVFFRNLQYQILIDIQTRPRERERERERERDDMSDDFTP